MGKIWGKILQENMGAKGICCIVNACQYRLALFVQLTSYVFGSNQQVSW